MRILRISTHTPNTSKYIRVTTLANVEFKFLSEDKEYTNEINLELKKLDYLLKIKQESIKQHEQSVQNDPLYILIIASLNEEP